MSGRRLQVYYYAAHDEHRPPGVGLSGMQEVPARASALLQGVQEAGGELCAVPVEDGPLPAVAQRVHTADYLEFLRTAWSRLAKERPDATACVADAFPIRDIWDGARRHVGEMQTIVGQMGVYLSDPVTPIAPGTWDATCGAARAAVAAAQGVLADATPICYALCRPPGHHAYRDFGGGFCYVNNAALAVETLVESLKAPVAVLDVDYHHGNGTQAIFYTRKDVFFVSLHADPKFDYPHWTGFADETGAGEGINANMNIPLPPGTAGAEYLPALERGLDAIAARQPAALVISLGFDTARGDPLGQFLLDSVDYEAIGRAIARRKFPRTVVIQEGGYRIDMLSENAREFFRGLLSA